MTKTRSLIRNISGKLYTVVFLCAFTEHQSQYHHAKAQSHFARYGIPDQVISDNGPQFASKQYVAFAKTWDFEHLTSIHGNSRANAKVRVWRKDSQTSLTEVHQGWNRSVPSFFFDYKNTPTQVMTNSLAQWLMGRRTKTLLPTTQSLLMPKFDMVKRQLKECQQSQAKYYNKNARDLADLSKGDTVQMKTFKTRRQVVAEGPCDSPAR